MLVRRHKVRSPSKFGPVGPGAAGATGVGCRKARTTGADGWVSTESRCCHTSSTVRAGPANCDAGARVAVGLSGTVVEIGFGSGLNLAAYPPEVQLVYAVEPAATARRLAQSRIDASHVHVEHIALRGESIPLADETCDGALSTFTLCTIPGVGRGTGRGVASAPPRRALPLPRTRTLPDASVATWQRRFEPLQKRLADGCHLTRDPATMVADAGFEIEHLGSRLTRRAPNRGPG